MFASSPRRPSAAAGRLFSLAALLLLLLPLLAPLTPGEAAPRAAAPTAPDRARVEAGLRSSPVMFIENVGQFDERARFQVRGAAGTMWLAEEALWFTLLAPAARADAPEHRLPGPGDLAAPVTAEAGAEQPGRGVNLKLTFVGANPHPRLEPFDRLETHVSSFLGNDPARWRPDVPVWAGVRYVDLYPGVDLEISSEAGRWTWQLVPRHDAPSPFQGEGRGGGPRLRLEGAAALAGARAGGGRQRIAKGTNGHSARNSLLSSFAVVPPLDSAGSHPTILQHEDHGEPDSHR